MNIVSTSAFLASLLILSAALCYILLKMRLAYRRKKYLQDNINSLPTNLAQRKYFIDTINRAKTYYLSYILHSILCLLCRLFSAIFTVCGFYISNAKGQENTAQILSILSVFFVLLSVYLIPQDRSKQYLLAWRQLDSHILDLLLSPYDSMSKAEIQTLFEKSNQLRTDIENSLKKDEDK